jgi:hypothetical protein
MIYNIYFIFSMWLIFNRIKGQFVFVFMQRCHICSSVTSQKEVFLIPNEKKNTKANVVWKITKGAFGECSYFSVSFHSCFNSLWIIRRMIFVENCFDMNKHAYWVEQRKFHKKGRHLNCYVNKTVTDGMFTNKWCMRSSFCWFLFTHMPEVKCDSCELPWHWYWFQKYGDWGRLLPSNMYCIFRTQFLLFCTPYCLSCPLNGYRNVSLQSESRTL